MKMEINFLKTNTKTIEQMGACILSLLDEYECTAPEVDIAEMAKALNYLKDIIQNIPIN